MKVYLRLLILTIAFTLVLTSCENNNSDNTTTDSVTQTAGDESQSNDMPVYNFTAKEIADAILTEYSGDNLPELKKYITGAAEDSDNYLEPDYAGILMSGKYGAVEEMNYAVDYAFYTPLGPYVFEIDVIKLDDVKNTDAVKGMLEQRILRKSDGDLQNYNAEEAPLLKAAVIIDIQDYVILLCTADNNKALNIINKLFGGDTDLMKPDESNKSGESDTGDGSNQIDLVSADMANIAEDTYDVLSDIKFDFSLLVPDKASGLPESEITPMPVIKVRKHSTNEMILLGGRCVEGAQIRVTGGTEAVLTGSDCGDWLVEVPIAKEGTSTLKVSAKSGNREWSDEIKFIVRPKKNVTLFEDGGIYGVVVGDNYFSTFNDCVPDFIGSNLISDAEKDALQKRIEKKYQEFRTRGMKTEIIYLLISTPMNIYEELIPSWRYTRYKENSLTKQFTEAVTAGGATVIDLTDTLMAHKHDEFKIYHNTDSHWTEYGAFWGYTELMKHIAKKFPDAAPRPITDFNFYNKQVYFGDIYRTLDLDPKILKETSVFCDFKFEPPCGHIDLYDGDSVTLLHSVMSDPRTTKTNIDGNFPSAYVFRDSFAGPIHAFLTDRFSDATWRGYWNYNYDIKSIERANPDYVIYLLTERNIRNIMYE